MVKKKNQFIKNTNRRDLQQLIDMDIFQKDKSERILKYLETPYIIIEETYNSCYENSWKDLRLKYST